MTNDNQIRRQLFARRMRLQYIFHGKNEEPHPFHVKSNWEPPVQPSVPLESYLERVKFQLAEIQISKPKDNRLDGKRGVRSVENAEYGKCGVCENASTLTDLFISKHFNAFIQHKKMLRNVLLSITEKTKTFLVYEENGEENVHVFTTRHKHLSKRKKKKHFNNLKFQLFCSTAN